MLQLTQANAWLMSLFAVSGPTYRPIIAHTEEKPTSIGMAKIGLVT